jgi:hypothetical protein
MKPHCAYKMELRQQEIMEDRIMEKIICEGKPVEMC